MTKTLHGRIRGKTIELDEDAGVADGQEVEVQVTVLSPANCTSPAGDTSATLPRTGQELVEYWRAEGLIGMRCDITDSQAHAWVLRQRAETRK